MSYRLTKVVPVHGCSCKLPQYQLGELLDQAGMTGEFGQEVLAGPWENSSVVKIADGIAVLNTLDFFTPMVDEPEIQGRIAGSNVTSDIYTLAVTKIASVLTIMAFPENMPTELAVGMLKGFGDFCREMDAPVVGGHTIRNPWPIIGGAATGIGDPEKIVYTKGAKPGDRLFLTKPIGIAPAMAAYRLRKEEEGKELLEGVPEDVIEAAVNGAITGMITSNKPVAEAMQQVPSSCSDRRNRLRIKRSRCKHGDAGQSRHSHRQTLGYPWNTAAHRHLWVSALDWRIEGNRRRHAHSSRQRRR